MKYPVRIPHTIIPAGPQKVQYWMYLDPETKEYKKMDEAYLKYKIIYAYFSDPNAC